MFNNQNEKIQDYLSHNEKSLERFIFFFFFRQYVKEETSNKQCQQQWQC
jgi:hypothetical protein